MDTQKLSEALHPMRAEYYGEIRDMARDYIVECRDGEIADREALNERIDQDVDGSAMVIYTFQAQCAPAFSPSKICSGPAGPVGDP